MVPNAVSFTLSFTLNRVNGFQEAGKSEISDNKKDEPNEKDYAEKCKDRNPCV